MASDQLENLFESIALSDRQLTSDEDTLDVSLKKQEGRSRQVITYIIIGVYSFVVTGTFVVLAIRGISGDPDAMPNIFELIKIGIVPIVTFVVGYYYGTASK